ncbi:unnamed protein product, partial [Choristocarpus tenellus]
GAAEVRGVVAVDVVEGTALASLEYMPQVLEEIPKTFQSMQEAVEWHCRTGAMRNEGSAKLVVPSRFRPAVDDDGGPVTWRTKLGLSAEHWHGWFEGLSKDFLALPVPTMLVVAGMDRLDTDLTAAHLQGRYQLKLVYGAGHSVQEDQPEETAHAVLLFTQR